MGREEYSRRRKQHVQRSWGETKLVIGIRVSFTLYMALPFYPMVLWLSPLVAIVFNMKSPSCPLQRDEVVGSAECHGLETRLPGPGSAAK